MNRAASRSCSVSCASWTRWRRAASSLATAAGSCRALEVTIGAGRPFSGFGPGLVAYPPTNAIIIGLELCRPELDRRLAERFEDQLARGLLGEVRALSSRPAGLSRTARQAIGYRELLGHVEMASPWSRRRPKPSAGCGLSPAVRRPGSDVTRAWSGSGPTGTTSLRCGFAPLLPIGPWRKGMRH